MVKALRIIQFNLSLLCLCIESPSGFRGIYYCKPVFVQQILRLLLKYSYVIIDGLKHSALVQFNLTFAYVCVLNLLQNLEGFIIAHLSLRSLLLK